MIVINKVDLVSSQERDRLVGILSHLNPRARIELSSFGKVPLDRVLNTGLFDFDAASLAPGWLKELRGEHMPETQAIGITSFVYRARRPFHTQRFWALVESEWPGVVRSKGFFWLATRPRVAGQWSQAGGACRTDPAGYWWAAVPKETWPTDADGLATIQEHWVDAVGDARQELVLIGMEMDEAWLRQQLDACLLDDSEMAAGPEAWQRWPDAFPEWPVHVE